MRRDPQSHAKAATDLSHRMCPPPELGGHQGRSRAGQADQPIAQEIEKEGPQSRRRQITRPKGGDEHHVDGGNRHLEEVCAYQWTGETRKLSKLLSPGPEAFCWRWGKRMGLHRTNLSASPAFGENGSRAIRYARRAELASTNHPLQSSGTRF
jgi:hypothetical protein